MILVTGATGTIGRELVPQLLEAGGRFVFSFATKKRWRKNGLRLRWGI
jgi:nucleoside-diphosphate-sugar epimerase